MSGCTCMIDVGVDAGDYAKVSTIKIRKAKKEHTCYECQRKILPGEKYEYVSAFYEENNRWTTTHTCDTCLEIRTCYLCTYYYGNIWNDLQEYFEWEEWGTLCT